ncbi:hypothetical protein N431DRAFT_472934 [Stipitochalara longipes BDJ]|nr:hypothetical protein N431DRAFT_472934 [Stipitochalara longipes BDJ]
MAAAVGTLAPVAGTGLTILSDPQDSVIDIVFIHGLQGHPQNTWTYKLKPVEKPTSQTRSLLLTSDKIRTLSPFRIFSKHKRAESEPSEEVNVSLNGRGDEVAQGKDVFWPRDLHKDDFPRARIMTFGYNTNITQGYHATDQGNIFAHARDLLYGLEGKRRKAADRDLVFIAHSLGGILVKEVLRRSDIDPDSWASFGAGIAGVAGRLLGVDTNDQVIRALLPTSPELEICRESFMTQWMKRGNSLVVRTFQESKGITGVRWAGFNQLIVPPDSSSLDHPNQRARTIDGNHIEMVKFSGRDDKGYEMVKEDIRELIKKPPPVRESIRATSSWDTRLSTQVVARAPIAPTDNNASRVDILTFPVRQMIEQDADYNQLSYGDSGGINLKIPYFDTVALTVSSSYPAPNRIARGNSAFELAEVLQLLPGQLNTARLKLQQLNLRTLVYDETSYYCRISLDPLIQLIIHHFTSVRTENNTVITRTTIGTFNFSRTTLGQSVRFSGRDRVANSVSPPEQLLDAVKKSVSGRFQRRKGAGLALHEDYSHIPLIWESMRLEEALIFADLEEPNCIRFMTKEDYEELQFQKNYATVVLENFVGVMEARAEDFTALTENLDAEEHVSYKSERVENRCFWSRSPEQNDSIYPREDRIYSQLYNRSRHTYTQQMNAFRRNRDEAANLETLIAITEENLARAIWQACFASLTKANSSIILVNAIVAPQQWIDLVTMPDVDILIA